MCIKCHNNVIIISLCDRLIVNCPWLHYGLSLPPLFNFNCNIYLYPWNKPMDKKFLSILYIPGTPRVLAIQWKRGWESCCLSTAPGARIIGGCACCVWCIIVAKIHPVIAGRKPTEKKKYGHKTVLKRVVNPSTSDLLKFKTCRAEEDIYRGRNSLQLLNLDHFSPRTIWS